MAAHISSEVFLPLFLFLQRNIRLCHISNPDFEVCSMNCRLHSNNLAMNVHVNNSDSIVRVYFLYFLYSDASTATNISGRHINTMLHWN